MKYEMKRNVLIFLLLCFSVTHCSYAPQSSTSSTQSKTTPSTQSKTKPGDYKPSLSKQLKNNYGDINPNLSKQLKSNYGRLKPSLAAKSKTRSVKHKPIPSKNELKEIIEQRLKSSSKVRDNIRRAVQPHEGSKSIPKRTFILNQPIYAAMVDTIQENSLPAFEKTIKKLKSRGINTLVIRMFQNYGVPYHRLSKKQTGIGVYYKSHFAPLVDDLLTPIIKLARRNEMLVFVSISSRRCDWASKKNPVWQDAGFDPAMREVVAIQGLNLFNHHVRYYLIKLFRELAQQPIDGIILSDDYALGPTEGYSQEAITEFTLYSKREGIIVDTKKWFANVRLGADGGYYIEEFPKSLVRYYKWRSGKLGDFAGEIVKNIRLVDPAVKVGFLTKSDFLLPESEEQSLVFLSLELEQIVKVDFDYYFTLFDPPAFLEKHPNFKVMVNTSRYMNKKVQGKLLWVFNGDKRQDDRTKESVSQVIKALDITVGIAYKPYNLPIDTSIINEYLFEND